MVDIHREGRSQRSATRRDTRHTWEGAPVVHTENQAAGKGEAIRHTPHLGGTVLTKHLVSWAARTWERQKTQAQPSLCLYGVPKNLNLRDLDLGSACTPGPTSDSSRQSNLEPEKYRPWKHTWHDWVGASPVQLKHCEHSPHKPVIFVWSVLLSPQHDWTSEL